jgi:hypothetical protein
MFSRQPESCLKWRGEDHGFGRNLCDDSPNRHATKHARATEHPVIASAEPGERWMYCYPDDAFAEH